MWISQAWWCMPLIPALWGRGRRISVISRPTWSTQRVLGQSVLQWDPILKQVWIILKLWGSGGLVRATNPPEWWLHQLTVPTMKSFLFNMQYLIAWRPQKNLIRNRNQSSQCYHYWVNYRFCCHLKNVTASSPGAEAISRHHYPHK